MIIMNHNVILMTNMVTIMILFNNTSTYTTIIHIY